MLGPIGEARENVAYAAQALVDGMRLLETPHVGRGAAPVETLEHHILPRRCRTRSWGPGYILLVFHRRVKVPSVRSILYSTT